MMRVIPAEEFTVARADSLSAAERARFDGMLLEYVSAAVRNQVPYFMHAGGVEIVAIHDRSADRFPQVDDGIEYLVEARLTSGSYGDIGHEIADAGVLGYPHGFNPAFPIVFSLEYWDSGPTHGAIVIGVTGYVGTGAYALETFQDLEAFNAACVSAHAAATVSASVSATGRVLRGDDAAGR
jgi:hypothetical protein